MLDVVVTNVHNCTFVNVEVNLPNCLPSQLACRDLPEIQEPHQGVLSCDRVLWHQQILIFYWLCHWLGHWCWWGKTVGQEHCLVVRLMSLVSSCWRFGWCKPFGADLLTSSGSIWPCYLGCHVPWPLREAFHVVPCLMPFESPGRWGPLLSCNPCRRCQRRGQRSQGRFVRQLRLFLKPCW